MTVDGPRWGSMAVAADEARLAAVAVIGFVGTMVGVRSTGRIPPVAAVMLVVLIAIAIAFAIGAVVFTASSTAFVARRTFAVLFVVLVAGCLRGGLAARSYQPLEAQALHTEAMVRGDPEPVGVGWRAEMQLDSGERLEATAFGRAGFELRQLAVGDRVLVAGRVGPVGDRPWLRARHIVGRLSVQEVAVVASATGFNRLVNGLRSVIVDGAVSFDDRGRSLYTGLVIGDDRFQPLAQQAQFRASGLTHLLAVSGQNVAFVLLVVRPILLGFGRRGRLVAIVGVLVLFAAMTRAEPSVLRASTTAGVATWALITGRVGSGLRTLSVGVTGLVMIDPFLVDVVGFQLSVAASIGIIVVSPLILSRLPVPGSRVPGVTALAQAFAVTLGAQAAVAPLLVHRFGPLPLASIPANLAAGWAAGMVMTLGLTIGPLSGLLHRAQFRDAAAFAQWPSRVAVGWVDSTAGWAAGLDLPRLGLGSLAVLGVLGMVYLVRPRRRPLGPVVAVAVAVAAVVVLARAAPSYPTQPAVIADGVLYIPGGAGDHRRADVLVVRSPPASAVDDVLASGVRNVELVVVEQGDAVTARVVGALVEVVEPNGVLAPPQHRIRGATRVTASTSVATEWGTVIVEPISSGTGLVVAIPQAATPPGWSTGSG